MRRFIAVGLVVSLGVGLVFAVNPVPAEARMRVRVVAPSPRVVGPALAIGALGVLGALEGVEVRGLGVDVRMRTTPDRDRRPDFDNRDRRRDWDNRDHRNWDGWDRDRYWGWDRWGWGERDGWYDNYPWYERDGLVWVPSHWEWRTVQVPGRAERVWVPGFRDDYGRWHRGHWERQAGESREVRKRVWVPGHWERRW